MTITRLGLWGEQNKKNTVKPVLCGLPKEHLNRCHIRKVVATYRFN
jgi:hypothetical protein